MKIHDLQNDTAWNTRVGFFIKTGRHGESRLYLYQKPNLFERIVFFLLFGERWIDL